MNIIKNIFSCKCKNFSDFYALRTKFINFRLSSPIGWLFNIGFHCKNFDKEYRIYFYPAFFRNWHLCWAKKDSRWTTLEGIYDRDCDGQKHNKSGESILEKLGDILSDLRLDKEDVIMDVGCAGGWFLYKLAERGWKNLIGVEPSKAACEHLRVVNKNIKVFNEYFGLGGHVHEHPRLIIFLGAIDRIPYGNDLSAFKKMKPEYIAIFTSVFAESFQRDWQLELAKLGYYCSKKETMEKQSDGTLKTVYGVNVKNLRKINAMYLFTRIPDKLKR